MLKHLKEHSGAVVKKEFQHFSKGRLLTSLKMFTK